MPMPRWAVTMSSPRYWYSDGPPASVATYSTSRCFRRSTLSGLACQALAWPLRAKFTAGSVAARATKSSTTFRTPSAPPRRSYRVPVRATGRESDWESGVVCAESLEAKPRDVSSCGELDTHPNVKAPHTTAVRGRPILEKFCMNPPCLSIGHRSVHSELDSNSSANSSYSDRKSRIWIDRPLKPLILPPVMSSDQPLHCLTQLAAPAASRRCCCRL